LALHAEVRALQQQLGLSYKDSAHRLFLAEVEKLKEQDKAKKAFLAIRQCINSIMDHELIAPMSLVDEGGEETSVRQGL